MTPRQLKWSIVCLSSLILLPVITTIAVYNKVDFPNYPIIGIMILLAGIVLFGFFKSCYTNNDLLDEAFRSQV